MDDTELHYLDYDADEMWKIMNLAYIENGGDVLYPGSEKDMLLRGMHAILVQSFAQVDNALRMNTLRYAVRDYLDLFGEKRNCYRMEARPATAVVEFRFLPVGSTGLIPAGEAITMDGDLLFVTQMDVTVSPFSGAVRTPVVCAKAGVAGNVLTEGTVMHLVNARDDISSITVVEAASGGQEQEDDDAYRERIRTYGLTNISGGSAGHYESLAKAVSSEIIDAAAVNGGPGVVNVYVLTEEGTMSETLKQSVERALAADDVRPLTDHVFVHEAIGAEYSLKVKYSANDTANNEIGRAVIAYKEWQDRHIGRAFNPDRLIALMYQAGASRVILEPESTFAGGGAEYTEIAQNKYCYGNIELVVLA